MIGIYLPHAFIPIYLASAYLGEIVHAELPLLDRHVGDNVVRALLCQPRRLKVAAKNDLVELLLCRAIDEASDLNLRCWINS